MNSFSLEKTHSYQPGIQPFFSFIHLFIHSFIGIQHLPSIIGMGWGCGLNSSEVRRDTDDVIL